MTEIVRGLSNDAYHHGEDYSDYISSTQLKHYLKSPKAFKHSLLHSEEERNENLEFGELFHSCIEAHLKGKEFAWLAGISTFEPPVNEKTGKPYGSETKAYGEAYSKFISENQGQRIVTPENLKKVCDMVGTLMNQCGETSEQVRKLGKWAKEIETSYFLETEDGLKLKVRPDLLTGTKLIDWKTCSCDLDEDSIVRQIIRYRYDVSLAMYQWVLHEITGTWYVPYLVFVNKSEPYDAVMVDMSQWCYQRYEDDDIVIPSVGAVEFQRLLGIHRECEKNQEWPGIDCLLKEESGVKVMKPEVPGWFGKRLLEVE